MSTLSIARANAIVEYFGYWPEFCDAKVTSLHFDMPGMITLGLHYLDSDRQISASVLMRFAGVSDMQLTDILSENVLDQLLLEGDGPYAVRIDAAIGLCGSFKCTKIEVLDVRA